VVNVEVGIVVGLQATKLPSKRLVSEDPRLRTGSASLMIVKFSHFEIKKSIQTFTHRHQSQTSTQASFLHETSLYTT